MNEKQLISIIKYFSGMKPSFSLTEIIPYLDEQMTLTQIHTLLSPKLRDMGLLVKKVGGDYEISRAPRPRKYPLSREEEQRIDTFFNESTFPPVLEQAIGQYIEKKVGKDWKDPVILERLRRAIVAQKDDYWKPVHKRAPQYTKGYAVLGYLAYHFPVYFMQTQHLLALLARNGLLKKEMTILDVGTGPGTVPLAIADFYSRLDTAQASIHSIERSEEHIEAFIFLAEHGAKKNARVTINPPVKADITTIAEKLLPQEIDLMIFSNVFNELAVMSIEQRAELLMRYAERLTADGMILAVEPAEEGTSTGLRMLALAAKKRGLSIYAPCSFIHSTNCTPDRCWSFVTAPRIRPTTIMNTLAESDEPFRYVNTDIKYSYVIFSNDGKTRETYRVPAGSRCLRLSKIHRHIEKRVNIIAAKMSEDLGDKQTHMFRLCDGSAIKPVFAVLPSFHITTANEAILSATYGSILQLKNVLVRYNKAYDAYNVLVSRMTRVSPLT